MTDKYIYCRFLMNQVMHREAMVFGRINNFPFSWLLILLTLGRFCGPVLRQSLPPVKALAGQPIKV